MVLYIDIVFLMFVTFGDYEVAEPLPWECA
jgi:hypothetical protein